MPIADENRLVVADALGTTIKSTGMGSGQVLRPRYGLPPLYGLPR
jgi:hypothetical protein